MAACEGVAVHTSTLSTYLYPQYIPLPSVHTYLCPQYIPLPSVHTSALSTYLCPQYIPLPSVHTSALSTYLCPQYIPLPSLFSCIPLFIQQTSPRNCSAVVTATCSSYVTCYSCFAHGCAWNGVCVPQNASCKLLTFTSWL